MDLTVAVCQDCEWVKPMPNREMAEHAKRVHEKEEDHLVMLE